MNIHSQAPSPPHTHRLLRAGERAARRGAAAGAATAGATAGGVGGLCSLSHASIRLRSARLGAWVASKPGTDMAGQRGPAG